MRIVNNNPLLAQARASSNLQAISERLQAAQQTAITGLAVSRPSDAPSRWTQIHGLGAQRDDQDVWRENAGRALDVLDTADQTLGSAAETLSFAWERAIELSNAIYTASDRASAADEIAGLREQLVGLANTQIAGRHVFAGDAYDGDAFDAAGNYLGASASHAVLVGNGVSIPDAIDGSEVFTGASNAFQALTDLETALRADDAAAITATITGLQGAHFQLVGAREQVGVNQKRLSDSVIVADNLAATLDTRLYEATAADPAEAYTRLSALQASYTAALQVVAGSSGSRLFDFIR